jgi:hypothetical protein
VARKDHTAFILQHRLLSQAIVNSHFQTPLKVITHMGAIQAQDFGMARKAILLRGSGITEEAIVKAMDKGKLIRTHVLRPTWHITSANRITGLLKLTAPGILKSMATRHKGLGLDDRILKKALHIIRKSLDKSERSREDIMSDLHRSGIRTNENRASHLLIVAELERIICSGTVKGNRHSYDLYERRIKAVRPFNRENELKKLAETYYKSRGPATIADFAWWSGLSVSDARSGWNAIKDKAEVITNFGTEYLWLPGRKDDVQNINGLLLLPAYDEWLLSYKDRSATIALKDHAGAVSSNGIFRPMILRNGKVIGTWKIQAENKKKLECSFFGKADRRFEAEAVHFAKDKRWLD